MSDAALDPVLTQLRAAAEMPANELREQLVENDGALPKRMNTSIRFPVELHAALTTAAEERDLSLNFLVVAAVREFLDRLIPADEVRYTRATGGEPQPQ